MLHAHRWLATAIAGLAMLPGLPAHAASTAPTWCPTVPGHQVECDTVSRPLVQADPALGTVDVAYALIRRSAVSAPAAGTIAVNPGGPGNAPIPLTGFYTALLEPLLTDHDLLLVDPRGTNASGALNCGLTLDTLAGRAAVQSAVARCGAVLGPRSRGYTATAVSDDIDAVRARIGVERLHLIGQSYGTYLMQVYARRHPSRVASIVLSGVLPVDADPLQGPGARAFPGMLRAVCERSAGACDADTAVADLRTFATRLRARPVTLVVPDPGGGASRTVTFTEGMLAGLALQNAASSNRGNPATIGVMGRFPAMLHDAVRGDYGRLTALAQRLWPGRGGDINESTASAMGCNDFPVLWRPNAPLAQRARQYGRALARTAPGRTGPFSPEATGSARYGFGDFCLQWPKVKGVRPYRPSGTTPDVPVLLLSGDLDANTPATQAAQVARSFTRTRQIVLPNLGHLVDFERSGCVTGLVSRFVRTGDPGSTACAALIPPLKVEPVTP
ncbi:alpha/beta fold hydrolase [Streptosporangium sp. NPDC000239]|uniref:alpha/beta fold hydrolase n=1 Tax=Streptosporangium sp. NPDC000239 TaxID=3154248 RepID=UPI003333DEA3